MVETQTPAAPSGSTRNVPDRRLLLAAFAASGFSGLIYESLWTHYLKLFLGHAAYAQTLVLAIFMGGLAAGSWICSRRSHRWSNLLVGYALAEGVIGVAALVFHPVFDAAVDTSYSVLIPALGSAASVTALKWTLGAALILPQSVLLGTTFPLMAGGFIRAFPERPGASLAVLYFCNSIGAAAGVLVSGFVLVPFVGLPGTGAIAGLLNLLLAGVVWRTARDCAQPSAMSDVEKPREPGADVAPAPYRLLLAVSLLTGTASFIYEIGWIRMLSLVLGSSTQAFELMLSAFILGLAFGGLWIRQRVDRLGDPVTFLGIIQVAMGVLAVATLPVYGWTLPVMQWLVQTLPQTDLGYLGFNVASQGIAMMVMLPAAFCAGTTLPLITYALVRSSHGERSIGAVYGANTIGAIVGIAAAVHIGLPILGLKMLIVAGAAIDIGLGLLLLWTTTAGQIRRPALATAIGVGVLTAITFGVQFDTRLMASGVFRPSQDVLTDEVSVLFYRDGKTATVHVVERDAALDIRTNGKVDASVRMIRELGPTSDEPTQVLAGALPLLIHPTARTAAAIGLGSGMTTHVMLGSPNLESMETVEIEPAMIQGAQAFRPRNERAYTDPRSHIVVDDAKSYFSSRRQSYDIIVSEPSNPWVSGIASLFSTEFYGLVRQHLNAGGLFVQWVQLYEFDVELVASVLKAMREHFDDYAIYLPVGSDMLVVGSVGRPVPLPRADAFAAKPFADDLARVGVRSLDDVIVRKIADRRMLEPWLATQAIDANSDYRPVIYHRAARARFLNHNAVMLTMTARGPLPLLELLGGEPVPWSVTDVTIDDLFSPAHEASIAMLVRDQLLTGQPPVVTRTTRRTGNDESAAAFAGQLVQRCQTAETERDRGDALFALGWHLAGRLRPTELPMVWSAIDALPCGSSPSPVNRDWLALFRAVGSRNPSEMSGAADRLLAGGDVASTRRAYVVAAGMLGHVAAGDRGAARLLWQRSQPVEGRELAFLLTLLNAHAAGE